MPKNKIRTIDVNTGVEETVDDSIKVKKRSQSSDQKQILFNIIRYNLLFDDQIPREGTPININDRLVIVARFALGTLKDVEYLFSLLNTTTMLNHTREYRIFSLVFASMNPIPEVKTLFRKGFQKLITSEQDLCDFTTIIKAKTLRGYGKAIQNATIEKLHSFDIEEFLAGATRTRATDFDTNDRSRRVDSFTLSDVIKLSHIKPQNESESALFKALVKGDVSDPNLPDQYVKNTQYNLSNDEYKLQILQTTPFSVDYVMSHNPGKRVAKWACLRSDVMQITRYFKTFYDFELLTHDLETIKHIAQVLSDEKEVRKSKLLPSTFFGLADAYPFVKNTVIAALYSAGEIAYDNMLPINGKVVMFVNQSAAMESTVSLTMTRSVSYKLLANTMCAMLYKKADDAVIIPYTRKIESISLSKQMSTVAISDLLTQSIRGTTSDHVLPFKYLAENLDLKPTTVIFINADKSWPEVLTTTEAAGYLQQFYMPIEEANMPNMYFINMAAGTYPRQNNLRNAFFVPTFNRKIMTHIL